MFDSFGPILSKKNCQHCSKVTIRYGIELSGSCIVMAGASVNKPFPHNTIPGGLTIKLIKTQI